jgi:hypothetical protein
MVVRRAPIHRFALERHHLANASFARMRIEPRRGLGDAQRRGSLGEGASGQQALENQGSGRYQAC